MKMFDRDVVVMFRGGSHVRNLNTKNSDDDLKYFVLPTREDLFTSQVFTKFESTETLDTDVQDVRRLDNLFYKANPAYLDLLFSPEIKTYGYREIDELLDMKNDIARMNLPYLFSASMGMFSQNIRDLQRPTSDKVRGLLEKYGYNPKKCAMAYHFARFLVRFYNTDFTDYQSAVRYNDGDIERMFLMDLRAGLFDLDIAMEAVNKAEQEALKLKDIYKSQPFNHQTHEGMKEILRLLVFNNL